MDAKDTPTLHLSGLLICLIGLLLISYSITLRIDPTFIGPHLLQRFQTSMNSLGELMVRYQFALLFTLIFAGFIIDLAGTRVILIAATIIATLGNNLFANATDIAAMTNGRIIVGFAHPFIFISVIKLGTEWLPKKYFPLFVAMIFAVLLMTPQFIAPLMNQVIAHTSWKIAMDILNSFAALLTIGLLLSYKQRLPLSRISFRNIGSALLNAPLWIICLISCLGWIANTFFLNWGSIYLVKTANFSSDVATMTIQETFLCFTIGALAFGLCANMIRNKQILITSGYWMATLAMSIVLIMPNLSPANIANLLFVVGLGASAAIICYTKAYNYCSPPNAGLAFGMVAFVTTAGNTGFVWLISHWLIPLAQNPMTKSAYAWSIVLAVIPACLTLGGALALLLPKSNIE